MITRYKLYDEPVGNPHGGAAYGEKLKNDALGQVIGVVTAGAAIATGVGMGGLLGGALIAGGVMKGVGTLSGDTKLAEMGGNLTLLAGAGSLASDFMADKAVGSTMQEGLKSSTGKLFGTTPASAASTGELAPQGASAVTGGATSGTGSSQLDSLLAKPQMSTTMNVVNTSDQSTGFFDKAIAAAKDQPWMATQALGTVASTAASMMKEPDVDKEAAANYYNAKVQELNALRANASNVPLQLDPADPNYSQLKQQANGQGITTVDVQNLASMWTKPRGIIRTATTKPATTGA